ncbi:MAG: DUF4382 domain-containing protein [Thermoplasmatota archaeon]
MRMPVAVLACLMTLTAFAGCTSGDDGDASVYVKDKPAGDWSAVHITFTEVSVHQSGGNESSGWKVLYSDASGTTVDLLNASGTRAAFLGASGLPAGHYQQVRIHVSKAHGVDSAGVGNDIGLPNGDLRTSKSFKVEAGKETQITIDIDLDHALTMKGDGWEFKPVIGKVYTHVKEKGSHPDEGEVAAVDLTDDA